MHTPDCLAEATISAVQQLREFDTLTAEQFAAQLASIGTDVQDWLDMGLADCRCAGQMNGRSWEVLPRGEWGQPCEWFALCDREARKRVSHPVLGWVPICDRCFERLARQAAEAGGQH